MGSGEKYCLYVQYCTDEQYNEALSGGGQGISSTTVIPAAINSSTRYTAVKCPALASCALLPSLGLRKHLTHGSFILLTVKGEWAERAVIPSMGVAFGAVTVPKT